MAKTSTPSRSFQMMFALLFVLLAGQLAFSSTPSSGALNPAVGSSVSWTGSSVGGATTDETTCVDGTNCDVFTITLTGLPSNYSGLVLSVHIGHNVPANDYDLHVHKGGLNGPVVASSTNGVPETGETVIIDPAITGTGTYTVHIVDSAVLPGDPVSGIAAIIVNPSVNHQATGTAPGSSAGPSASVPARSA